MPPKKKPRKRKRASSEDQDRADIEKKLKDKYGKKSANERTTAVVHRSDNTISNPTKHDATVQRCVQNYLNKLNTPEEPKNFVPRKWLCVFCGHQSCYGNLGDLFGPYYITGVVFPDFLPLTNPKPSSSKAKVEVNDDENEEVYSDVWFHGSCALWTPNLMFFAGKFPRLAEIVQECWHQRCKICKKPGASIPIESQTGHIHFPCAINKHYRMEELTLRCRHPLPASASHSHAVH